MPRSGGRVVYLLLVAAVVYALVSVSIAIATSDRCGRLNAAKHWTFVPPRWECGAR